MWFPLVQSPEARERRLEEKCPGEERGKQAEVCWATEREVQKKKESV